LARSLPDEALAFLAHTALQPPVAFDGDIDSNPNANLECDFDLDIDDGDGPRMRCRAQEAESKYVVEKYIYSYGDTFRVKFTLKGQLHRVGSFTTIEEARAARDSALSRAAAAAHVKQQDPNEEAIDSFTACENEEAEEADDMSAPTACATSEE
jgi:hypothetical protein